MNQELLDEAYEAGENDTITEDNLIQGALLYIENIVVELSDENREKLIEEYRRGFMGKMQQRQIEALADVVRYLKESESTHYEETPEEEREGHIYEKTLIIEELIK